MQEQQIKILLIEDDEDDYVMIRDLLSEIKGMAYDIEWVTTYDAAIKAISLNEHNVYLVDYRIGERTGLELIHEAVKKGCNVPIIILTGQEDRKVYIETMKAGSVDYLIKGKIDAFLLERSIHYAIERKKAQERVLFLAYYDDVTSLPNRLLFRDRVRQAIAYASRYKKRFAVLFLDLDNFKQVNDTLGHSAGDILLKEVACRLSSCVRESDSIARYSTDDPTAVVARLGGDEFIILLTEITHGRDAAKVAQRILDLLSKPFKLDRQKVFITASIGITIYPLDGEDTESLLKNADIAMYHAKNRGKNNYQFYEQVMNVVILENLTLENNLRKALAQKELLLYYQPRIDVRTKKITAIEALMRWQRSDTEIVRPAEFIPLAEKTGLIIPMGEWLLHTACAQNKAWQVSGLFHTFMSVNISGEQFKQQDFIKTITQALDKSELDPKYLEVEITESILQDAEAAIPIMRKLKTMGIRISLDDFGMGYSSFKYLKSFPLDVIKIDRYFISDVATNPDSKAIIKAIIAMAHVLKLKVVAEGVETEEQSQFLLEHRCDEIQGYLITPPLPAEEATKLLKEGNKLLKGLKLEE